MKWLFLSLTISLLPLTLFAQNGEGTPELPPAKRDIITEQPRPRYCDEFPLDSYNIKGGRPPLPKFSTSPTICYKIQVAVLRKTDPFNYPMHGSLHARWRPCEEVWVVESKDTYCDRKAAEGKCSELKKMGYSGAYLTQLVSYEN